jgi:hypothetical protein
MVVHVEHALLAFRTMVAAFWFEVVADQAEFALIWIFIVKSPHNWNFSWVCNCNSYERPHAHSKEEGCGDCPPNRPSCPLSKEEVNEIDRKDGDESEGDADEVWVIDWEVFARSQDHMLYYEQILQQQSIYLFITFITFFEALRSSWISILVPFLDIYSTQLKWIWFLEVISLILYLDCLPLFPLLFLLLAAL